MFEQAIQKKIIDPEDLESFADEVKQSGRALVTLNGSFDLLHPGHLQMIYEASCQGDLLLMLLNTDKSIQTYKSPFRPINPLRSRLLHIAALEMVDYVSWFDETDPRVVLEKIKPAIHVNGSEYGENCIEAEVVKKNGGRIHIVTLIPGYSSTNMINKIKSLCE